MGQIGQGMEQRGIDFVTRNDEKFLGVLDKINASVERVSATIEKQMEKAAEKASKSTEKIEKSASKLDKVLGGKLVGKLAEFGKGLSNLPGAAGKIGAAFTGLPAIFESLASPATAAAAAVIALTVAVFALGQRGAAFVGIQQSFQSLAANAGLVADVFLNRLKTAAASTISELELMRQTNLALAGATGQFRTDFAEALPRLLEIARVQARATGQSVEYLFSSLVTGIKRSSPLLIDNTGLVLKIGEATETYAASLGKTAEQLTTTERQQAILNATLAAGAIAIDAAGGLTEGAAEKFARIQARFSNIFDKLGVAVQPLYELILDGIDFLVGGLENAVNVIAPILQFVLQQVANFVRWWTGLWGAILTPVFQVFGWIYQVFVDAGARFLLGASSIMGAFANGLVEGYNRYIFPALLTIVTAIADFLVGQSPPPKGPLSKIDEGGANTMQAWIDGFAGVSMQPVEQAAAFVSQAMGSIATASLSAVEKRLRSLDKAIQPFVNQLEIAKARFEAIQEPAEAALRAIDRQLDKAVEALNRGDAGSDKLVQNLDARREALLNYMDAQQASADDAQFQLLLAKAQQAEERALLGIRQKQLQQRQKQVGAEKKLSPAAQSAAAKEKKGEGPNEVSEVVADTSLVPATGPTAPEAPSFLDQLGANFNAELDWKNFAQLDMNNAALGEQLGRLENANFGERIGGFFSGVGDSIQTNLVDPIKEKVDEIVAWFTDEVDENGLVFAIAQLPVQIGIWLADLGTQLDTWLAGQIQTAVTNAIMWLTGEDVGSLRLALINLPANIATWLVDLPTTLSSALTGPVSTAVTDLGNLLFALDNPESMANRISTWFTGTGEGTLSGILDAGVAFFTSLPTRIATALQPVGLTVWNSVAVPIIEALNNVIDNVNQFIDNNAGFGNLVAAALGVTGLDFGSIDIPRLTVAPPSFLVPQAAKGGIFGKGLLSVGERGQEYIANASSKLAVFPNNFVRAMDSLSNNFSRTSPARPVYGNSSVNNSTTNSRTQNNTLNFVRNEQDMMQRMAILKAYGGKP
jgi:hypothetical protein